MAKVTYHMTVMVSVEIDTDEYPNSRDAALSTPLDNCSEYGRKVVYAEDTTIQPKKARKGKGSY